MDEITEDNHYTMPSKEEKARRKAIQWELAEKERQEFLKSLPVDPEIIVELFNYLDKELEAQGCEHDYSITKAFLASKQIQNEGIFEWFRENGGYCDCEILFNIEDRFDNLRLL